MLFVKSKRSYRRDPWINIAKLNKRGGVHKIRLVSLHWLNVYSKMKIRRDNKITDGRSKLELELELL